jgi:hypothetical protein
MGFSAGGAGEARGVSRMVVPHGASRAAHTAGVPRYAARWAQSWPSAARRLAPVLPWRLGPGHRGNEEAANTCWAAVTPAPRATG